MGIKATVVLLVGLVVASVDIAKAQQPKKFPRIGVLGVQSASRWADRTKAFSQGLHELGYKEGQNIIVEYQWAQGDVGRLPGLAAELVRLNVDIIFVAGGSPAVVAAKNATTTIPIIFVAAFDPVGSGLVASLARPGGNITGLSIGAPGLYGKRLELLKEIVPRLSRVGVLLNPTNPGADVSLKESQTVAQTLDVQIQSLEVRSPKDIDSAFDAATKSRTTAVSVMQHTPITTNPKRITELAAKLRLPAIYADREWIEAAGLMSYGPSLTDLYRRSAIHVDKILKGAKPADLPVEQPTKFEFIINLKTAKQIGLTIPQSVLFRADRVIK
jgi:putative tryptophan/tyrosine transport system substrate-binding protein